MKREIFLRRGQKTEPGFNIAIALGKTEVKGDVGLEIEVEGNKFPKVEGYEGSHHAVKMPEGYEGWSYVHDGSLRGKDNAEYVLTKPILFSEVPGMVGKLFDGLRKYGSKLDDSNRTSVHVHLNCQRFHFNRLASFVALYVTFEEVLTQFAGDHRVGNLFCLRAKDAPAIVSRLRSFIQTDGASSLDDNLHYAGLNAHALVKFGSLEIRTLRGATDQETVINWVKILQRLYEKSEELSDPRDIPALFSSHGPLSFFDEILGDLSGMVRQGAGMTFDDVSECMFTGIRLAQDICYCRDWDVFKAVNISADPFGRDGKKMAKRLFGLTGAEASDYGQIYGEPSPMPMAAPATLGAATANAQAMNAYWSQQAAMLAPVHEEPDPFWEDQP
jgi:hypothetical protein